MADQLEKQRTNLQRRKISAAIKLERIQRYGGEEPVKEEVIQELEREYETSRNQLRELEISTESRKRRELQTLRRFGLLDAAGTRYSLPDIDISHDWISSTCADPSETAVSDEDDEVEDAEEEAEHYRKKPTWKALGWLVETPFFRPRSRSETPSRKYRAMSAGVVANTTSTTVKNLRRLYTGRSEFYDIEDEPGSPVIKPHPSVVSICEPADAPCKLKTPINPKVLNEIARFESLIQNYFRKKNQSRH